MTFEETIAQILETKIQPLVDANRRLATEVEQLRRALPEQVVTVAEAARVLGVHPDTVRRRINDGSIPVRRVGKSIRVVLSAVLRGPTEGDVLRLASDFRSK